MHLPITTRIILCCLPLLLLCLLAACDSSPKQEQTPPAVQAPAPAPVQKVAEKRLEAKTLLAEPIESRLIESPEMALPVFRESREQKPVLVLLANNPLLAPLPEHERAKTIDLLTSPPENLASKITPFTTNPPLISDMTVSAALAAGYFSRVEWMIPSASEKDQFSGAIVKSQLIDIGAISEAEAASFQENNDGTVVAVIRDTPWHIVHYTELPKLDDEVVVYLDLDFFQPLYKGEIKTPLLDITYALLNTLRAVGWKTLNLVICHNNLNVLPLETRFLGNDLAAAFHDPQLIAGEPPLKWQQRKNALYLENFMQSEKIHDIYRQMLADSPEDASVKFGLYQILRRLKRVDEALDFLAQAVATDRYYGLEYLNLAAVAAEKSLPHKRLEMLDQARAALPDNPFITLESARVLKEMGHQEQAAPLTEALLKLDWSPTYFPAITDYLHQLAEPAQPEAEKK